MCCDRHLEIPGVSNNTTGTLEQKKTNSWTPVGQAQTKKLRPKPTKINSFMSGPSLSLTPNPPKIIFDIRTVSENAILTFEILFWNSNLVGKSYFDIRNPILTLELSLKIVFWYSNPILTFKLSRKMLFWYSKSYFDIRTESENQILTFKILFFTFDLRLKMQFWYSKSYFDIRTESENRTSILTFEILFWHSNCIGKCYFVFQNPIWTFDPSRKILFWHSKSYFDIRTQSENPILTFKILFWLSK